MIEQAAADRAALKELQGRVAARRPRELPPCIHLRATITNEAAARIGLSTLRNWKPCAKNHGEKGHVCGCKSTATCAGCPDYEPPK